MVLKFADGSEYTIDLVRLLLRTRNYAKINGFKRLRRLGDVPCEVFMQNPCVLQLKLINPDNMPWVVGLGQSSNDEEDG